MAKQFEIISKIQNNGLGICLYLSLAKIKSSQGLHLIFHLELQIFHFVFFFFHLHFLNQH